MRRLLMVVALSMLIAGPAFGAAKGKEKDKESTTEKRDRLRENWPTSGDIARAMKRIQWNTGDTIEAKFRNKTVKFTPTDFGDIGDEVREKGFILGKLVTETASKDELPAGTYLVYARKPSAAWEVYFCKNEEPEAKSKNVLQNQDNEHEPKFKSANTAIHYWRLIWDF